VALALTALLLVGATSCSGDDPTAEEATPQALA